MESRYKKFAENLKHLEEDTDGERDTIGLKKNADRRNIKVPLIIPIDVSIPTPENAIEIFNTKHALSLTAEEVSKRIRDCLRNRDKKDELTLANGVSINRLYRKNTPFKCEIDNCGTRFDFQLSLSLGKGKGKERKNFSVRNTHIHLIGKHPDARLPDNVNPLILLEFLIRINH